MKTRSCSFDQPGPTSRRYLDWRFRWVRKTVTVVESRSIDLRPSSVLVRSEKTSPPLRAPGERTTLSCWRTSIRDASRSTSDQRSPHTSPLRIPVMAATRNRGPSGSSAVAERNVRSSAGVHHDTSGGRVDLADGAVALSATLRERRPFLTASDRARCSTEWM